MPYRELLRTSLRGQLGIFLLGSVSNVFLSISQYLAVSAAVASYLPVDHDTATLITAYGTGPGIVLSLLPNSFLFEGILAALVVMLARSSVAKTSWRWAYSFSGVVFSAFVGYWLGAKFLTVLEWISALQNNRVDSSTTYASLFWFGLASTICYIAMILVLRRSYGKLSDRNSMALEPYPGPVTIYRFARPVTIQEISIALDARTRKSGVRRELTNGNPFSRTALRRMESRRLFRHNPDNRRIRFDHKSRQAVRLPP